MTVNHGLFLFDMAEPSINGWENQLGWRGYYEEWKNPLGESLWMQVDEDVDFEAEGLDEPVWELLLETEELSEWLTSGTFREVDAYAKKLMTEKTTLVESR